jgi:hypothetical protein
MGHPYEILADIPETFELIQARVREATSARRTDRARRRALISAGEEAQRLLAAITASPPLWLALQRQVLIRGWSFNDLPGLETRGVRTAPLVQMLVELHGPMPPDQARRVRDAMSGAVTRAWGRFGEVQGLAVRGMRARGTDLPTAGPAVSRSVDATVIDDAHWQMHQLREALARVLVPATSGELTPAKLQWVLEVCIATTTIVGALTAVLVGIPEVWGAVRDIAADLARMLGDLPHRLGSDVALLGVVVAIRQTDQMLASAPDGPVERPVGPSGLAPTDDLGPTSASWQVTEPLEVAQAEQQQIREQFVGDSQAAAGEQPSPFDPTAPADQGITPTPGGGAGVQSIDPTAAEIERLAEEAARRATRPVDDDFDPSGGGIAPA